MEEIKEEAINPEKNEEVKKENISEIKKTRKKFRIKLSKDPKVWIIVACILALIFIIYFGSWIRTQNIAQLKDITTGEYTLGPDLDPFLFLRYAQEIEQGTFSEIDMMRYTPAGGVPTQGVKFIPYTIFYLYKFLSFFSKDVSIEYAAIIYPVICFAFSLLFFFLLVQKIFSYVFKNKDIKERIIYSILIALIATILLAVLPSHLHRTMAGIPEKEAPGMFLLWLSFYCIFSAWQAKGKKSFIFAVIAGLATGLMFWVWGGVKFIFLTFGLFAFLSFFFNKITKKQISVYSVWLILSALVLILIFGVGGLNNFFMGIDTLFAFGVFSILIVDHIIFNTKLKEKLKLNKIKIPHSIISLLIVVVIGIILTSAFFGFGFVTSKVSSIKESLLFPFGRSRVGLTVAENRQPFFVEWLGEFGRLFFWGFFIGTILLFYEAIKHFDVKKKCIFILFFILFITTFIFSRYSPQSIFNGTSIISQIFYFGGLLLFIFVIFFSYFNAHIKKDNDTLDNFKKISFSYLFVLIFIFLMILASRGAIRLFFISGTAFILAVAFMPFKLFEYGLQSKDQLKKIIMWGLVVIIICLIIITLNNYAKTTSASAKATVPGSYYQQWQKAMGWVRENTPKDSLFIHWWDYGYWIQTIGERATVTDGGHAIGYWDHLIGRYLLTAQEEKTALQLCKSYGVDYLLIDSTDIGKYSAYGSIGSDETGNDRLSWINTFVMDESNTRETRDELVYLYVGSTAVDEDIIWQDQLFPRNKAGIGGFIMTTDKETQNIKKIETAFFYNNKQYSVPLKSMYINNQLITLNEDGIGTLYIIARYDQGINHMGAALYISDKAMATQWVKLYLFDQSENFELVYKEDAMLINQIRSNYNLSISDFLVFGSNLYGPIKIWQVNYPENIQSHEEYLSGVSKGWGELDYLGK